ncbi:hypothetical protein RCL1_007180 [Eukaryota sp. TZLM3-RCL]
MSVFQSEHEAWFNEVQPNGSVKCLACAHGCIFSTTKEGKLGKCGVRGMFGGKLRSLVYGRPIASNIDPIEKKPLHHFLPGTDIYSIGTYGCNLKCLFCQNWQISQATDVVQQCVAAHDIESLGGEVSSETIVNDAIRNRCPSIAFTYTEPAIAFEFMYDTAKLAKERGLRTVAVTNGYWTVEGVKKMAPVLDAVNIDLKGSAEFYRTLCGATLEPVQQTIMEAFNAGIHVEVTNLVIEGHNDSDEQFHNLCRFVSSVSTDIPLHFSACYPTYKLLDIPRTSVATLTKAEHIAKSFGQKYVYLGNIGNHENTTCPNCHQVLVERPSWGESRSHITGSNCECGCSVYGVWS